jgi:endoglycosylceramidase
MRTRLPARIAVLVAALAATALIPSASSPAKPPTTARIRSDPGVPGYHQLTNRGRWMVDAKGRVVILHGINVVAKLPPYDPATLGFGADDANLLKRAGFNTVRLGIIYTRLETTRGTYDDAYLDSIARVARMLGHRGMHVVLDFHQDMYNERFNGEGFPDWAVQDDGIPAEPDGGFPANYFVMPALSRAFDHLWANDPAPDGTGLQDALAQAWTHVADRFKDEPSVFGYDVLNEPWPGTGWQQCLQPGGCPLFDATLTDFYTKLFTAIRTVDPNTLVFYEPHPQMAGTGADVYIGDTGDPHAGFTFHFYCLDALGWPGQFATERCPIGEDRPFQVAEEVAKRNGDALLMSEFGASDDLDTLELNLELMDRHMMSWQYWTWWGRDPCCERPGEGVIVDAAKPATGDNVKLDKVRTLSRPYPRAVAGTPISFEFDRDAGTFALVYRTNPAIHAPTVVYVPPLQYPHGYTLTIKGPARRIGYLPARLLLLRSTGGGTVKVTISRSES